MEMPEPPRADAMSRRRAADHESGWEAGSRTWSQTASKQGPCREAGQGIKGDREEVGCGGCERPSRARGWGGPGPRPQRPTSGGRECPAVPGDPGREGEVREVHGFF